MIAPGPVTMVGAGPSGALLAILLRRRGFDITLYESRKDPRAGPGESGRSINLALADRGIHALQVAGVYEDIAASLVTMRGRLIHHTDGTQSRQLYGQRPSEVIYSISRHRLTQALLAVAVEQHGVDVQFEHRLQDADFHEGTAQILDLRHNRAVRVPMQPLIATDGGGSIARRRMAESGLIHTVEAELGHGYKELTLPATAGGDYALACDALHIWPRGNFMLIALPNADASFTATLFLPNHGAVSFETLDSAARIEAFLRSEFPDAYRLMPACVAEFRDHPTGLLGTVYADGWSLDDRVALVGDAAHAIVPFHGQGMNCCFEDCLEFDACVARQPTWRAAFEAFYASRKPNTDAIAAMALENYLEMRERVIDPKFRLQQQVAMELERRHPQRFIPRYSMVMFHHEIPYEVAQQRGTLQARLLTELTTGATTLAQIDWARADHEINRLLSSIPGDDPA